MNLEKNEGYSFQKFSEFQKNFFDKWGKFVRCSEIFYISGKIFVSLKWYTDRNFFGDGGGLRSPKIICSKKNFFRYWSVEMTLHPPPEEFPEDGPGYQFHWKKICNAFPKCCGSYHKTYNKILFFPSKLISQHARSRRP